MKCDENGGCPMGYLAEDSEANGRGSIYVKCARQNAVPPYDCHLTPDSFDRIRAEIAGEWSCENCGRPDRLTCDQEVILTCGGGRPDTPCKAWQRKGER